MYQYYISPRTMAAPVPFDTDNLGRDAAAGLDTDLGERAFFGKLPEGGAVLDKSFASVQTMNDEGFTFTYRLARVSFPKIREYGLKWDERSRTMYATQQTLRRGESGNPRNGTRNEGSYTLKGIQSRNPRAINGSFIDMPRGLEKARPIVANENALQNYITNFKRAFAVTYPTGLNNDPKFILAKSDYRSDMDTLSLTGETRGVETDLNIPWADLMAALNDVNSVGSATGLGAGGLKNRFLELNKAAHKEVNRRYKEEVLPTSVKPNTTDNDPAKGVVGDAYQEVLVPVRLRRFPKSSLNHSQAFNYGSLLSDYFESGDNESTRKLEQKLKVTSVELIKTLANNYEVNAQGKAEMDGGLLRDDPDGTWRGVPKYKVNQRRAVAATNDVDAESGSKVRFWQPHDGELLTAIGRRRQWRMALLEYEPLMNHSDRTFKAGVAGTGNGPSDEQIKNMITNHFSMLPAYNQTFMKSRLLNLRQYVLVIYLLDSNGVQQYYACAPEKLESLAIMVSKFHEAVKSRKLAKPASQGGMEHMRISSFDPSSGFKKTFDETWTQILKIRPLEYNPFSRDEFEDNYSPALYTDLWDTPMPLFATKDRTIKFDIDKGGKDMLEFLANLPGLSGVDDTTKNYMESVRGLFADNTQANLLSVPQIDANNQTTLGMRRSAIVSELSVRHPRVVISPVVNQAFRLLREQLGINKVSSLTPAQKQRLNRQMEEIFRPRGNLFLSYVFGLVLHNALTPRMLGVDLRTTIGYRNVAQVLLDTVPFIHSLGRYEAMAVFQHDVVEKLIGIAQSLEHARAERTLQNVLYHALGNFEINGSRKGNLIFGLPVGEIVKSYNTLKRNAKVYEDNKLAAAIADVNDGGVQFAIDGAAAIPDLVGAGPPDIRGGGAIGEIPMPPKMQNLIKNFLYYKFVALDKTYQQNHVLGLKFDPFGPDLRKMDRETREFMYSTEDTKRRMRNRDERFGMPNVLTTTSVPDVQTLDSVQGQALRDVGKIGAPTVMLDDALTKAQMNRRLMGL